MVNRCVLFGCSATADASSALSTHSFPKKPAIRRQWVKFVQTTRADFVDPKPTNTSAVVCSKHFTDDCFEVPLSFAQNESGFQKKCRRLKKDAVPTIPSKNLPMKRVSSEMEFNSNSISDDIGSSDPFSNFENGSDEPRPSTSSGAVGGRSAYKKRERKRLLLQVLDDSKPAATDEQQDSPNEPNPDLDVSSSLPEAEVESPLMVTPISLPRLEAFTPVIPRSEPRSRGRPKKQTTVRSKATECNIAGLPPLTLLPPKDAQVPDVPDESVNIQGNLPSPAKLIPYTMPADVSWGVEKSESGESFFDDPNDVDWEPEEEKIQDLTIDDDGGDEEAKGKKYVVYEKELLDLFSICRICCVRGATAKISTRNGTSITIEQDCLSCDGTNHWTSQP
ncbi:uncharacterized protein LOC135482662 [Lineus longissimus]|uniref:uncharacterized protein LOC135482662 n=1 Tax=Lineus longissimus TaxID=88925 RepID=UPI00315DA7E9